ncbi:hypothetical protein K154307017_06950 [Clostridium tetani]|uniref:hypothetical protein n=1 Tax=Clostridium tetani TaxID=1513 RepID=UPI002954A5DF|nr:hypothetical protein [Clostridium tetani]BDR77762.1 hypothetical protein K154307017_06950 [Clostridium tetani]
MKEISISSIDGIKIGHAVYKVHGIVLYDLDIGMSNIRPNKSMAYNTYGKTMNLAHSMFDGDTIFTLGTSKVKCDVNTIGMLAVKVMERSVLNGIKMLNLIMNT